MSRQAERYAANRISQWSRAGKDVHKAMTADEAIKLGGLDFKVRVSEEPVSVVIKEKVLEVDNKFITYGEYSDGKLLPFGVVGNRYTPIQNQEAFDFLNNIVDESGALYHTAGVTGSKCWINMKLPDTITVAGGADSLETYLTCVNSHDGSSSFKVYVSHLRLICTNGLKGVVRDANSEITLRHTQGATLKVQQARESLQLVWQYQESFEREVQRLLDTPMTDNQYKKFVEALIPEPKPDASTRKVNSVENVRSELLGLWKAPTQQIVANTAWAAYNAVTEYVDWFRPVRGGEDKDTLRAEKMLSGNSKLKNRAFDLLSA